MTTTTEDNLAAPPRGFAAGYSKTAPQNADEMVESDGSLRAHWRPFVSQLDDLGPQELPRRWEQARRLIRENGITHNVYGDPNGHDRIWNLDMVPLLIPASEWRELSSALAQRAVLLDALMADLYGPNRCLEEGLLPAELVYNNPGFLRPCHGISLPKGQWLQLYAADLIRSVDGRFHVLGDRTQAPSGAGYSLENRIVLSSVLPSAFRQCNVHRLAPFFIALRQTLTALARPHRENPRIVLLTPGPYNETYFEHAYLARYLGYTLVQGKDLTVRDARVYLKTLGGLQQIDVILRRVDDDYCDPLEFYYASYLGVPGLVEAVRQGNVAIANPLGTGVLQTPAFLSFLPSLCRRLLGEDLKLPSVQTYWCGDPEALKYVLANLRDLVIKPAYPTPGSDPQFAETMSRAEVESLAARISARPADFVAQEQIVSRTAPVLFNDHLEARRFVVRAYLTAAAGSYTVMQGGLTRVTGSPESRVVSLQKGGGSKDTWVLADAPVTEPSLLAISSQPVELNRGGGDLPSRVADDLFWLGRYVQRAEGDVRMARTLFGRLIDTTRGDGDQALAALAAVLLGKQNYRLGQAASSALMAGVFGPHPTCALRSSLGHVQSLVRALRDRISADAWRILQGIERDLSEFDSRVRDDPSPDVVRLLNRLAIGFLAFEGVVAESMTRGQAWRFLDLGGRVERSIIMARLIRATVVNVMPDEPVALDSLLEIADSSLTYRRRYFTQLQAAAVVDLLAADGTNPRAIAFQLAAIEQHVCNLPRESLHPRQNPHIQLLLELRSKLGLMDLQAACAKVVSGARPELDALMICIIDGLEEVAELVGHIYFSHAAVSRRLTGPGEEGAK